MTEIPRMVDVIPEGTCGVATVRYVTVSEEASRFTAMRGYRDYVEPGRYAQLLVRGHLVMSDTSYERRSNRPILRYAKGRVLVAGLGLGMVLTTILKKPEVEAVVVVESELDVTQLVEPHVRRFVGRMAASKLTVLSGDIFQAKPTVKALKPFDALWFDIWGDCSTDTLHEMTRLTRMYGPLRRTPAAFMDCWDRDYLRDRKRQERR